MVGVTSMSRVAGMALVSGMGIVRVVTGRVVVTRVTIVHGVVVLRLVAVVLLVGLVMTGVAVARCASATVVIVVGTVLVAHTGLVSADVPSGDGISAGGGSEVDRVGVGVVGADDRGSPTVRPPTRRARTYLARRVGRRLTPDGEAALRGPPGAGAGPADPQNPALCSCRRARPGSPGGG